MLRNVFWSIVDSHLIVDGHLIVVFLNCRKMAIWSDIECDFGGDETGRWELGKLYQTWDFGLLEKMIAYFIET